MSNRPLRADGRRNHDALIAAARELMMEGDGDVSLREVARRAGVGPGTLHRHFVNRDALLEALLRSSFHELATAAARLADADDAGAALFAWVGQVVGIAHRYRGALKAMAAAIDDEASALHAACIGMKQAGGRLLERAQAEGRVRSDIDGIDLFALIGAAAWIADQPALASRHERLTRIIADGLLPDR